MSTTGAGKTGFGGVEAGEVSKCCGRRRYGNGVGVDMVRVVLEYEGDLPVKAGEFEVGWLMVVS